MSLVTIIIPTFNNFDQLRQCLESLQSLGMPNGLADILVINNGHAESCSFIPKEIAKVITPGENLGWEGALKIAVNETTTPYLMFLNDDTFFPPSSKHGLQQLLGHFNDKKVGAVGPASNVVMGLQNIFTQVRFHVFPTKFIIGLCFLVRRSALEEAGGIDDSLPGGDDLDLSIRLRKAGYTLIVDKTVFIYHHGFQTGVRVHGGSEKAGGWNSFEMWEKTNHALIKKHGFITWWDCMKGAYEQPTIDIKKTIEDSEGNVIRKYLKKGTIVYDLGCGGTKTVPWAIGVDMVPKDTKIDTLTGNPLSQADIEADVSQPLPFASGSADTLVARHILEHLMDSVTVIKQWKKVLKRGGQLIIAVPNNGKILSIPLNIEHCVAFNPDSLEHLVELCGFTLLELIDPKNNVSFVSIFEKV